MLVHSFNLNNRVLVSFLVDILLLDFHTCVDPTKYKQATPSCPINYHRNTGDASICTLATLTNYMICFAQFHLISFIDCVVRNQFVYFGSREETGVRLINCSLRVGGVRARYIGKLVRK